MVAGSLAERRILVTRPRHQAESLGRAIAARGGRPCLCPMLEIEPLAPLPSGWWQGSDWLIFVSANAVRFALAAGLPADVSSRLAAIGRATASALRNAGLPVACEAPPPYTSESLLEQPAFSQVVGRRLVIVRGRGGRSLLGRELQRRGGEVVYVELYRRRPPGMDTIAALRDRLSQGIDAVLITSGEALAHLQAAVGDDLPRLQRLPLVVASQRLARLAAQAGFTEVILAASAQDEAMLAALERYFANR